MITIVCLVISATSALLWGLMIGWYLRGHHALDYKKRWLEAVGTLHIQEARYTELLIAGSPEPVLAPERQWRLVVEVYDRGQDTQRTCFLAQLGNTKIPLECYRWKAIQRAGLEQSMSTSEVHIKRLKQAEKALAELNRHEAEALTAS